MKPESIVLLAFVGLTVFFVGSGYYYFPSYNNNCLEEIAEIYCENRSLSYEGYFSYIAFSCEKIEYYNPRYSNEMPINKSRFYFLEEELTLCLTKEEESFRKLDANQGVSE